MQSYQTLCSPVFSSTAAIAAEAVACIQLIMELLVEMETVEEVATEADWDFLDRNWPERLAHFEAMAAEEMEVEAVEAAEVEAVEELGRAFSRILDAIEAQLVNIQRGGLRQ
jgi:hypothetical protein